MAEALDITLLLTHISENIQHQFSLGGLTENGTGVCIFRDLDHGLEWCEDQLLDVDKTTLLVMPATLPAQLVDSGFEKALTTCLMAFLEQVQIKEGECLIRQENEANTLYFIERGRVSIYLALENGKQVRLQTLGPGTVVGELGLYLGATRTASVIADSPTIAYRLTQAALLEMKEKEPELAATFHEFVVRLLSERLSATNRLLEAVLK